MVIFAKWHSNRNAKRNVFLTTVEKSLKVKYTPHTHCTFKIALRLNACARILNDNILIFNPITLMNRCRQTFIVLFFGQCLYFNERWWNRYPRSCRIITLVILSGRLLKKTCPLPSISNLNRSVQLNVHEWQFMCYTLERWLEHPPAGRKDEIKSEMCVGQVITTNYFDGSRMFQKLILYELYHKKVEMTMIVHIDGLVQERRNSGALATELRLSWTNPSKSR